MKGGFVFTTLLAIAVLTVSSLAETPRLISYQGRLTDASGVPLADGAKGVRFIIWNDPTAVAPANELWNSGPVTVTTTDGLFAVNLGQSPMTALDPAIFTDTLLWLGISVGADPEISPRTRLVSSPYSLSAEYADSSGTTTDRFVDEDGDTITGSTYWTLDSDTKDAALVDGSYGGANLHLYTDGASRASLYGDRCGTLYLKDEDGTMTAELNAHTEIGGTFALRSSSGDARAYIEAGLADDTCGALLVLNKGASGFAMALSAIGEPHDARVQFPSSSISSGETADEAGLSNSEATGSFIFTSGSATTYTVDSVQITIPAAGYVIVEVGGYLNIYHTTGTNSLFYVKSDKTAGSSSLSPGVHVARIPAVWPSSGSSSVGMPIHSSRLYNETSSGAKKYYLNVYYNTGVSTSSNLAYRFIRATYYPTLYGTSTLASVTENGGPSVMMGDPSQAGSPATATEVITVEEHNARVEAALAEQREALEARMKALEDRMQQLDDRRETDAGFGR